MTENSVGQNQARLVPRKIAERAIYSQSSYTAGPRRRSFDSIATSKPRQNREHVEEEPTTATIVALPTSLPPSSLPQKSGRHTRHQPPSTGPAHRRQAPKTKPSRGNTTPRRRHRPIIDQGFPRRDQNGQIRAGGVGEQATMPPRRSTTATTAAIAGHGTRPRHDFHQAPHHLSRTSSCIDVSKPTKHDHHRRPLHHELRRLRISPHKASWRQPAPHRAPRPPQPLPAPPHLARIRIC